MRDPSLFDVAHSGRKISKAKEENHGIYEKKGPPHSNSCRFQFVKKEWAVAHGLIRQSAIACQLPWPKNLLLMGQANLWEKS
jgi:hypothetical protein